jgi:flavin-dependent dehydrogenase
MSDFDVAIIGAGIGGTSAAIKLAQSGCKLLLLEAGSFPRHKVCGEFLSPESRAIFQRLGVLNAIENAGAHPVAKAALYSSAGTDDVARIPLTSPALGLSRYKLDEILWRAARQVGAVCYDQSRVRSIEVTGEYFEITAHGSSWKVRHVLDATGRARLSMRCENAESQAPRFLGLKAHFQSRELPADCVELHFARDFYCGVAPIEDGLFNICLLTAYPKEQSTSRQSNSLTVDAHERLWQRCLEENAVLQQRMQSSARVSGWLATANVQFAARAPLGTNGIMRVGDAAGYIHPLAGDGIAMAARSGELAAASLLTGSKATLTRNEVGALYESAWHREFDSRLRLSDRLGTLALSPFAPTVVKFLRRVPRAGQLLVRGTRGAA